MRNHRLTSQQIYQFKVSNRNATKSVLNMFENNSKDNSTTLLTLFWCRYCQLWTYFTSLSSVSIVNMSNPLMRPCMWNWYYVLCQENFFNVSTCLVRRSQCYYFFRIHSNISNIFIQLYIRLLCDLFFKYWWNIWYIWEDIIA